MKRFFRTQFFRLLGRHICLGMGMLLIGFQLQAQIITTVAGTTSVGDGGPATDANIYLVFKIAVDASDNLFIADYDGKRILRVGTDGILTTILTLTDTPKALATDSNGNLFIATFSFVYKRDVNGTISTVAGGGVYNSNNSEEGIPALNATFANISALSVDGNGNIYIGDESRRTIRKVDTNGIITTVIGTNAGLNAPYGIAVDANGLIYVADFNNSRIRKRDSNGNISTVAGTGVEGAGGDGGPAINAQLNHPTAVAIDAMGNLLIADANSLRVRKIDANGIISTIAGNGAAEFSGDGGPAINAGLNRPFDLALGKDGSIYFPDYYNQRIRKIDPNGIITTVAGNGFLSFSGDGRAATRARLSGPQGVSVDDAGNVYIADTGNNRLRKIDTNGIITTIAGNGGGAGIGDGGPALTATLVSPVDVVVVGNTIYVCHANLVRKITPDGIITTVAGNNVAGFSGDGGPATNASLNFPRAIALDSQGNLYIADYGNYRVRKVDTNGIITTVAGNGSPTLTRGNNDEGIPATSARINPSGVAVDAQGNLFIAQGASSRAVNAYRIQKVNTQGIISTIAGNPNANGGFSGDGGPAVNALLGDSRGLTIDKQGNLFIADYGNQRIRRIDPSGIITTVAGGGSGGDGDLATNASLKGPSDVAVDRDGNLFIADLFDNRIRRVGAVSSITGQLTICAGESTTLTATGGTRFTWSTGATTASISVSVAGTYSVTVANSSGTIVGSASASVTVLNGLYTVKAGNWDDATVWSCGRVPTRTDAVTLNHNIIMPDIYVGRALRLIYTAGGRLTFGRGTQLKLATD